ncbi:MAG: hypothetical protein JWO57_1868 [Pseudonocardiales bacterium]|nr:hypothetical protein [Pseudonocardiales bacterium]
MARTAAWSLVAIAIGVILAAVGVRAAVHPTSSPAAMPPPGAATPMATTTQSGRGLGALPPLPHGPTGPAHAAPRAPAQSALPVRLTIPAIGVDTPLEHLGLLPDHTLRPPARWDEAGWYADGVRPGDPGPAVIAGHVDSVSGPAVFYRLRELRPGAVALVVEQSGVTLRFVIDTVAAYPKNRFPTARVYGPSPLPELSLVTCTGDFDWNAHSYLDNLVVTAHVTA